MPIFGKGKGTNTNHQSPLKSFVGGAYGEITKTENFSLHDVQSDKKYIDRLQEFVQSLNSRHLNSLGRKRPKDVSYESNGSI